MLTSPLIKLILENIVAQVVKNLPAMQETWVGSLAWEDPWEKEMATHSNTLAWRISWIDEDSLQSIGIAKSWDTTVRLSFFFSFICQQGSFPIRIGLIHPPSIQGQSLPLEHWKTMVAHWGSLYSES